MCMQNAYCHIWMHFLQHYVQSCVPKLWVSRYYVLTRQDICQTKSAITILEAIKLHQNTHILRYLLMCYKCLKCFEIRMICFSHIVVYFKICRRFFYHTIKKLHSRCQHLHRHCTKLRTMCGNYSESARNFAFFSEKSCQQKFFAPCVHDGRDKYHLWSWHNVLCLQGRPSWLWNWQTPGRKPKPEYHYSIVASCCCLGIF